MRSTRHGRCPTSRRCSTTTRCSRAPTCTAGRCRASRVCARCAARRSTGRCARCAAPRAASARRSTPTPRASRASSTSGRSRSCGRRSETELAEEAIAYFGASERGNFEAAPTCSRRAAPSPSPAGDPRQAVRGARERVRPGLDDKRLTVVERADDLGAGRRRRGARARATTSQAAVGCAEFVLGELRDDDGRLLRTWKDGRGRHRRLPRGPRLPARGAADAVRGDLRPALVPRGGRRSPTTMVERFADGERGGFFTTAADHERLRAPQGPRGFADPVGQLGGRLWAAAAGPALGRGRVRAPRPRSAAAAAPIAGRHPLGVRSSAAGGRLLSGPGAGGGDRRLGPDAEPLAARRARRASARIWCWPEATADGVPLLEGRDAGRRARGRLRVRALRLPGAGDRAPKSSAALR